MAHLTFLEAIADALKIQMRKDESVFMIGEDIGTYGGAFKLTKGFLDEFGSKRIIDAPISEAAIIGAAIGAAINGMRPIVEMQFMDFITCGFNQLVNVAGTTAYRWGMGVPLVVRGPSGGGVGANPFHSRNSEAWFVQATGIKVVCPSSPADAKGLLTASIEDNNPVIFYEHKGLYRKIKEEVPEGYYSIPLGKANIVKQGNDASIITYGSTVHMAKEAAEKLEARGISVEIIDIRTLVPFDEETVLASVKKTNRLVVLEEAWPFASVASEITYMVQEKAFDFLDAPVQRITTADTPAPYSPTLLKEWLPNAQDVIKAVRKVTYK
jgi:pyruvate/2-oxoglutarate/acetoin dehydrogenase E1 component